MAELPVPGTVHQVDTAQQLQNVRRSSKNHDIILLPQPSEHVDDPLNWSKWRTWTSVIGLNVYTAGVVFMVSSYTPANLQIQKSTGIPVANINTGVGIYFLFIGYSNLVWQPLAINYGRRPVLLLSFLLVIIMALWQAWCTTTGQWYANRILMGISAAPVETLPELIFADLHFSHQRGYYLSFYVWLLFSGPFLSNIPAGFVATNLGWKWIEYIVCMVGGAFFIWLFFTFEETSFYRPEQVSAESLDSTSCKVIGRHDEEEDMGSQNQEHKSARGTSVHGQTMTTAQAEHAPVQRVVGKPKPYLKRLGVLSGYDKRQRTSVWRNCYLAIALLRFPAIIYSGLLVALSLSWFNVVNGSLPTVLSRSPYNFSANIIGVFYIAGIIGVTFGSYFAGRLSDIVAVYMARRNNGVFEPEHRLWVFLIALVLHPCGCLLFGIGAAHSIHWIGIAFGLGIFCAALPMGSAVAYNYIIDSYKEVAGEGMVSVVLIRNTIGKSSSVSHWRSRSSTNELSCDTGFGFAYAILPMINALGLQNAFILLTFLGLFIWCLTFIMIFWGKNFRRMTAKAYWKLVEEQGLRVH